MGKDLGSHFSKEYIQLTNKHMTRCSMFLLVIREMQVRITMRYHFAPTTIAIILTVSKNVTENGEKLDIVHCSQEYRMGLLLWQFLKKLNR